MVNSIDIHGCPFFVSANYFLMYCFSNVNLFLDKCFEKGNQNLSLIQYFVVNEIYLRRVQEIPLYQDVSHSNIVNNIEHSII